MLMPHRHSSSGDALLRIDAIARDYAAKPDGTLIVSPDNRSRQQINEAVRVELQKAGKLGEDAQQFQTLSHRSDMTGPDRTWAAMYRAGDVIQYERGSKAEGIERGAFGVVRAADSTTNRLTVELADGASVSYDPKRVYGVNVYREVSREVASRGGHPRCVCPSSLRTISCAPCLAPPGIAKSAPLR